MKFGLGGSCNMYMGNLWFFSVHDHFGVILCICLKWPVTPKRLTVEQHGVRFETGGSCSMHMGYLCPFSVTNHFWVILCTCLRMACDSNISGRRAKRSEIWDFGGSCSMHMGYLCPFSFGALVSK